MTGFFQKWFGSHKPEGEEHPAANPQEPAPDAVPDGASQKVTQELPKDRIPENHWEPAQMVAGCAQSIGLQRDHNEDALFTLTTTLSSNNLSLPFGLYIVADGMGGHKHGEIASDTAVRVSASYLTHKLYLPLLDMPPSAPQESIQEIMRSAALEAHHAIMKEAPGGGTTLTAALVMGGQLTIAHVGDSRAYLLEPSGSLQALTRDHSLVQRLVELGQISAEEAAIHPQRNVLYRALGQGETFDVDITTSPLPHSASLLLCSDGLWGVVPEDQMARLCLESPTPQLACQKLVEAANEAGGPDNITVILVHLLD